MELTRHLEIIKGEITEYADSSFSILLIGERGTGKSSLLSDFEKATPYAKLEESLKKASNTTIIIDLIEYIPFDMQKDIFNLISTGPENSLINIDGEPKCPQIIFTSQLSLNELYNSKDFYNPFIDRIAQQIFELPPIRKLESEKEYKEVWISVVNNLLLNDFEDFNSFIKKHSQQVVQFIKKELFMYGNFRDVEKLAITLWRKNKSNPITSSQDLTSLLMVFKKTHETERKGEFFDPNATADDMIKTFRKSLIEWAEIKFSDLTRAELINRLKISEKTYYNWKNKI